jgi:hypothetical protein
MCDEKKDVVVEETPVVQDEVTETKEDEKVEVTEENLHSDLTEHRILGLVRQLKDMVGILEAAWHATEAEFKLTDTHMKELMAFNTNHLDKPADDISDEEREKWDPTNGIDKLTEEDVVRIFGEEHPIIGVTHDVTMDRVKDAFSDFYAWLKALREYGDIQDSYMTILEEKEQLALEQLTETMNRETDPVKKEQMQKAIDQYNKNKTLGFMKDALNEKLIDRIVKNFKNDHKISYWIQRTRDKLKQMHISQKFILEISHFETRFLEEKYHKCDNILLMYFMSLIVYAPVHDKKNVERNKAACMVYVLDRFIRNKLDEENKKVILDNVIALEDQFIEKL